MTEPRLFGTHTPFPSLPKSVKESRLSLPTFTLEDAFETFCNGVNFFGPWWSHVLGYWKASIDRPNKVLFLKYEDLKEDTEFHVKERAAQLLKV
ncbi:unnamed protein product [Sphenostylis stenocarpa]|uniref:Sulfotransferase n=1 Tax=Sphenostylis stenocarpa TaxID=92480 RepID=A0AA86W486_9FABA|nr:unnamed protein product [Sphenostylis stenocarpa]